MQIVEWARKVQNFFFEPTDGPIGPAFIYARSIGYKLFILINTKRNSLEMFKQICLKEKKIEENVLGGAHT